MEEATEGLTKTVQMWRFHDYVQQETNPTQIIIFFLWAVE